MKKFPNQIDVHVGSRIRLGRTLHGKSQEWLGDKVGVTFQQIQKYEKGTNRVGASRLQQISEALDVPIPYFFESAPEQKATDAHHDVIGASTVLSSKECILLATAYSAIEDKTVRQRILALVRTLAGDRLGRIAIEDFTHIE